MRILLVEDDADKAKTITALIAQELDTDQVELIQVATVNDAFVRISEGRYDLVIVDLVLPQVNGGNAIDATSQWCELIENHLAGRTASWIVMTGYAEIVDGAQQSFARHNVAVIPYDSSGVWQLSLTAKLRDTYTTRPLDFLVICALEKERRGFEYADCVLGQKEIVSGLDSQPVTIGALRGAIVVQPNPGMISAAIVTTSAVSVFRPRAVAMSGICGGREGESELGALIVPDVSWNYQAGKFKDGKLTADLLQVLVPPNVRTQLSQLANNEQSAAVRKGLMFSDLARAPISLAPMVSGSQVVADASVSATIGDQGRKVAGIDMEVASVYFAAREFFDGGGIYFAAKAVVDLADPNKGDHYHEYGCAVAARFVANALKDLLAKP